MNELTIEITKKDLENLNYLSPCNCPIASALKKVNCKNVSVGGHASMSFTLNDEKYRFGPNLDLADKVKSMCQSLKNYPTIDTKQAETFTYTLKLNENV